MDTEYIFDIIRFLALPADLQTEHMFGANSDPWISNRFPMRTILEEFTERVDFLIVPDEDAERPGLKQLLEEMKAFVELLIVSDEKHPFKNYYTSDACRLLEPEWCLLRRLAQIALTLSGKLASPFERNWKMIFAA